MGLGYEDVADIVRIIEGSACDEFILETNEFKLVLRRRGNGGAQELARTAPAPASFVSAPVSPAPAPTASVRSSPPQNATSAGGREVRSPMVGTFYRAPSPGAPNFVEVGSTVKKGDPLCIIEVMKLFTTIQAEFSGRIVDIGAENNELVEFGRLLFVIEENA